ncbi:MAG: hypothetical protein R2704_19270 [Microthrixaceae bacterium]
MSHPSKQKGDKAEREAAAILAEHTGLPIRRKLGAGRTDDEGDIEGLDGWTIEVKNYRDIATGVRRGMADCTAEQANAGTTHGVAMVRLPGGRFAMVQTIEQWAATWRETL